MTSKFPYQAQLNTLLEDQNNIVFFCDLVKAQLRSNPEDARKTIDIVIGFCDANLLDDSKAWMLYYLSKYYFAKSMLEKSSAAYESARVIFEKNDNLEGIVYIFTGLIKIYLIVGKIREARLLSDKCITLAKALGDDNIFVRALLNNALLRARSGESAFAFDIIKYVDTNYGSAMKDVRVCDAYKLAYITAVVGDGRYGDALAMLKTGDFDSIKSDILLFNVNRYYCYVYTMLENYEAAMEHLMKGLAETSLEKNALLHCNLLMDYARRLFFDGKIQKSIDTLNDILRWAGERTYYGLLVKSNNLLYLCHKELGDSEAAIGYLNKSIELQSQLHRYRQPFDSPAWRSIRENRSGLHRLLHDKSELIASMGSDIISEFEVSSMLANINKHIRKLVPCDSLCVSVYDEEGGTLTFNELRRDVQIKDRVTGFESSRSLSKHCITTARAVLIEDSEQELSKYESADILIFDDEDFRPRSIVSLPLIFNEKAVGAFTISSLSPRSYTADDMSNLKLLAGFLVTAIKNGAEYKSLESIAIYDSLTGCFTKKVAMEKGAQALEETRLNDFQLCVFMIDMDNLKHINDCLGHAAGDVILGKISQIILDSIGKNDFVGRYGGDEFVLVSPNTTIEDGYELAERIRSKIEMACRPFCSRDVTAITVSIGVFNYHNSNLTFEEGLRFADYAMYRSKSKKRNGVFRLSL